jgi:hypothetical protein
VSLYSGGARGQPTCTDHPATPSRLGRRLPTRRPRLPKLTTHSKIAAGMAAGKAGFEPAASCSQISSTQPPDDARFGLTCRLAAKTCAGYRRTPPRACVSWLPRRQCTKPGSPAIEPFIAYLVARATWQAEHTRSRRGRRGMARGRASNSSSRPVDPKAHSVCLTAILYENIVASVIYFGNPRLQAVEGDDVGRSTSRTSPNAPQSRSWRRRHSLAAVVDA